LWPPAKLLLGPELLLLLLWSSELLLTWPELSCGKSH
jgi:hypothetical protein